MDNKQTLWSKDFILAFLSNLTLFFAFYILVPTLPFYVTQTLGATESIAGVVLSLYTVAALLIRPFSGFLVDKFARKPLYIICYMLFTSVFAGYLVASALTLFIVLRILHGFVFGVITVSSSTLAIDITPSERRGEGIGYFGMSINIAMAIGPMVGLFLYEAYPFEVIFWVSFISSIFGMIVALFIKAPHHKPVVHKEVLSLDRFILVKGLPGSIVFFTMAIGYGVITNYIGLYSKEIGMGSVSGIFFTIQAIAIVGARLLSGKMVNEGRLTKVILIGTSFLITAFTVLGLGHSPVTYYCCAMLLGLGYGYVAPAFQTMFVNLAQHNRRGTANSTYFTAWDFGIGIGIATGGYVIDNYSFSALFLISLGALIVGAIFFVQYAAPYYSKNKLR